VARTEAGGTGVGRAAGADIVQVAISTMDGKRSRDWYQRGLDLLPAGSLTPTADMSATQGVAGARIRNLLWLVDSQDFVQLEIFEYSSPPVRPLRADREPSDIGYARVAVWVADFDAALARLARLGARPAAPLTGPPGARRGCVFDPDGIMVEVMEDFVPAPGSRPLVRPGAGVALRAVTASVPNLDAALRFFRDAIGMTEVPDVVLHTAAQDSAQGRGQIPRRRALLTAGQLWLELAQYEAAGGRPRPADYRITDQGILNIAVASRTLEGYLALRDRVTAAGYQVHAEIAREHLRIQYALDPQGFSVEMGYFDAARDPIAGFCPSEPLVPSRDIISQENGSRVAEAER
jgi:catechol 2,3-dioxygenase-like lactoylglutathione lyase family enzyme